MQQKAIFQTIQHRIKSLQAQKDKPIRVAVNGIEGTGKTVFAQSLTDFLLQNDLAAVQVSIDGFHFNKAHRYRQGRDSAKGYFEDSYNEEAFVKLVLLASQGNPPQFTSATHDLQTDAYLDLTPVRLGPKSILITDGAYLFKPNYRQHWDLKVYLKTDFATAEQRGIARDALALGGEEQARAKFQSRYHQASGMYLEAHQPEAFADIVIDNTNFDDLKLLSNNA